LEWATLQVAAERRRGQKLYQLFGDVGTDSGVEFGKKAPYCLIKLVDEFLDFINRRYPSLARP
jgi:hypothetical protein